MDENRQFDLENAEYKLKETLSYLGCLHSEESITSGTYQYLYDNVLHVLNNIIQDELYKDTD